MTVETGVRAQEGHQAMPGAQVNVDAVVSFDFFFYPYPRTLKKICLGGGPRGKHQCEREASTGCLLIRTPPRDQSRNMGMCPDWESNL